MSDKPDYIEADETDAEKFPDLTAEQREVYEGKTAVQIAQEVREHWKKIKDLKDTMKEENKIFMALSRYLHERMETAQMDGFKVKDLGTVYMQRENKPYVNDKEPFFSWLRSNGHAGLIQETVHPMRLLGLVNELVRSNKPLPEGIHNFVLKVARIRSR